ARAHRDVAVPADLAGRRPGIPAAARHPDQHRARHLGAAPGGAGVSAPRAARAQWADIVKGYCIILVVLWHVIMKQYLQIDWHVSVPLPGAWGAFGEQFLPLRMPVFFTVSGM